MAEIYVKQKRVLAACIYLLSVFWGFHSAMNTAQAGNDLVFPLLLAAVVTAFCLVDAKVEHKKIPILTGWLIFFTWPVSAPIALFWIHGKKKAFLVLLFLLSVVAVCFAGSIAAYLIGYVARLAPVHDQTPKL